MIEKKNSNYYVDNLIYTFSLNDTFNEVELYLNKPLNNHTAVVIGSGEVYFTFE